jgi:hypothetical protein
MRFILEDVRVIIEILHTKFSILMVIKAIKFNLPFMFLQDGALSDDTKRETSLGEWVHPCKLSITTLSKSLKAFRESLLVNLNHLLASIAENNIRLFSILNGENVSGERFSESERDDSTIRVS